MFSGINAGSPLIACGQAASFGKEGAEMGKVTNKEIAERAHVSQAAVSIAIHGKKGISEETRAHILSIVRELGYQPPSRVHSSDSDTVVLLVSDMENLLLNPVLGGLTEYVVQSSGQLRMHTLSQVTENPERLLDGCRLLITFDDLQRATLNRISQLVPRILILNGDFARQPFINIRLDYSGAAYALTRYMTDAGHRNFIYLNQDLSPSKNLICFAGFQRLILEMRLPLNPVQIVMDLGNDPNVWSHFPDIIRSNNISAIVCTSEHAAVAAVNQLSRFGLQVPKDVSVAAISARAENEHPGFSFTRVSLNLNRLEKEVCRLAGESESSEADGDIMIPCSEVLPGSSTGAPKFSPAAKRLVIALYLKEHPTLRIVRAGFLNKTQQMGYQAEVVGISGGDEEEYFRVCQSLVHQNVDGVIMWLHVPKAVELLDKAGIPVVCLHGAIKELPIPGASACVAAEPRRIADTVCRFFDTKLRAQRGCIAVSQSAENSFENAITRELKNRMKQVCPGVSVRHDLNFANPTEESLRLAIDYLRSQPDLLGIFTTTGFACVTWAAAKKAVGRDDLPIVGTDYNDETLELLDRGEIDAFVAQPIYEEPQVGVVMLDAILRGNSYPYFSTLDAPLVTKENAESYRRLLQDVKNWYV